MAYCDGWIARRGFSTVAVLRPRGDSHAPCQEGRQAGMDRQGPGSCHIGICRGRRESLERACKSASDASDPSERGYLVSDAPDASDAQMQRYSYGNWLHESHGPGLWCARPVARNRPIFTRERAFVGRFCASRRGPPSCQLAIVGSTMKPLERVCKSASGASGADGWVSDAPDAQMQRYSYGNRFPPDGVLFAMESTHQETRRRSARRARVGRPTNLARGPRCSSSSLAREEPPGRPRLPRLSALSIACHVSPATP